MTATSESSHTRRHGYRATVDALLATACCVAGVLLIILTQHASVRAVEILGIVVTLLLIAGAGALLAAAVRARRAGDD